MKSNLLKKTALIVLAVLSVLFFAGLIGTPYLIKTGIERWIASQGPETGEVENIDFNPFTGRLAMDNLVVETTSGRTLNISHAYLQFSWRQLFRKQLYLRELVLSDAFMLVDHLEESGLRVGGMILRELMGASGESDTPGWEVGIGHFAIENLRIEYDTPELVATYFVDKYTLDGLETWNKKKPVMLELQGRIDQSPVHIRAEVNPLDVVKSWKGNIVLENGSLELFAKVRGLQEYAPRGNMDLDLDLEAFMPPDSSIAFTADGTVTFKEMQLQYEDNRLQEKELVWQGRIDGSRAANMDISLAVDGQLTGADLDLDNDVYSTQLLLGAFNWQGQATVKQQDEELSLAMNAGFKGSGIAVNDGKNAMNLLAFLPISKIISGLRINRSNSV